MLSFANKKHLKFIITLGVNQFGSNQGNQVLLEDFRASVDIDKAGGMMMGTLRAKIYGVSRSDMNAITTLQWKPQTVIPNTIQVYAIDGPQETLVFRGTIINAWGEYDSMPDVGLTIQAQAAYFNQLYPVAPRSYRGTIDVATVMASIAQSMGYAFENTGVSVQMSNLYLSNTDLEQAKTLAEAANIDLYLDDNVLAITPRNVARKSLIPEISSTSGLRSYPTFDGIGVAFQTMFNPAIVFGGAVKLVTEIEQARGQWIVTSLAYKLESEKPGGAWFASVRGNAIGLAVTK